MRRLTSVIICTYNRAHLLKRALHALSRQTMPVDQFEVIVVDDGSQDATPDICATMSSKVPNLRYLATGGNLGQSDAANVGVRTAQGEGLLFTDDDCIPYPDWAERISAVLAREPIVAGAVVSPGSPYMKLCHNIAQFYPFMPGNRGDSREFIAGANMGFNRSVFDVVGDFQAGRRVAFDMEFILRARRQAYRVYFQPEAKVLHDPERISFFQIWQYAARHAAATIRLRQEYREVLQTPFVLRSPGWLRLCAPLIALKVTIAAYAQNRQLWKFLHTAPVIYALKFAWCWGAASELKQYKNQQI